jgi:hypothetical protein
MTMIDNAEMGDDNTILGPVPHKMGSRNTIVADADANGNVIHNRGGTAIGYGARADSTSVAIGGRAMGGDLPQLADLLRLGLAALRLLVLVHVRPPTVLAHPCSSGMSSFLRALCFADQLVPGGWLRSPLRVGSRYMALR